MRNLLKASALITELLTLQAYVDQDDGCDEPCVGIAEEQGYSPGHNLHACSEQTEFTNTELRDLFAYATCRHGTHDAAESEHPYHVASCSERWLGKMKGEARPYGHHAAETKGGTDGVDAYRGVENDNLCHGAH